MVASEKVENNYYHNYNNNNNNNNYYYYYYYYYYYLIVIIIFVIIIESYGCYHYKCVIKLIFVITQKLTFLFHLDILSSLAFTCLVSSSKSPFCFSSLTFKVSIALLFSTLSSRWSCTWLTISFFFCLWYSPIGNRRFLWLIEGTLKGCHHWLIFFVLRFCLLPARFFRRNVIQLKSYHFSF